MNRPDDTNEAPVLREKLRILELENDRLAERAEETLLLGLISEKIKTSNDPHELIERGLEQISILKDITFGACCDLEQRRFLIRQAYCSRSTDDIKGEFLTIPSDIIGPLAVDSYILDEDDCRRVEFSAGFSELLRPSSLIMIPLISDQGREYYFVFGDDRPDIDFAELRFLLHRVLEVMISRIDRLDLLEKLTALNLDLDMKVGERTRDLQTTNQALKQEVAERRDAEAALRASESRFRTLAENAFDAIFILDDTLKIIDMNEMACRILDYEREELLATEFSRILSRNAPGPKTLSFPESTGGPIQVHERTFLRRDGSILPVETRTAAIRLDGRRHLIIQARDVSEQQALEEQLLQSVKMEAVGRLAGGIAHDFNNILMTIIGHVDLTLMDLPDNHPIRPDIVTIGEAAEKASHLTRQLLAFSRKEVVAMSPMNLNGNISKTSSMLRRVIGEDIELVLDLDPDCGNIKADPGKIEQILMNLVINARDAMPNGGRIRIATRVLDADPADPLPAPADGYSGKRILLSLSDSGTGIAPEIQENIFDPFFSTKDSSKGTGLGLSTVYGLIQQHNARISVASPRGEGACFEMIFPEILSDVDGIATVSDPQPPTGDETLLLVEDNASIRNVFSTMLTKLGYNLLIAGDGIEALDLVAQYEKPIDLALTDVIMPRMNGKLLVDRLLQLQPDMKVIYMSGYTDDMIGQHGVLEDGMHFIQKPITFLKLATTIRSVLGG